MALFCLEMTGTKAAAGDWMSRNQCSLANSPFPLLDSAFEQLIAREDMKLLSLREPELNWMTSSSFIQIGRSTNLCRKRYLFLSSALSLLLPFLARNTEITSVLFIQQFPGNSIWHFSFKVQSNWKGKAKQWIDSGNLFQNHAKEGAPGNAETLLECKKKFMRKVRCTLLNSSALLWVLLLLLLTWDMAIQSRDGRDGTELMFGIGSIQIPSHPYF